MIDLFIFVVAFTYHALNPCLVADRCTHGSVAIAETVATDDHIIESVIVFLFHLLSVIIQIITQSVQLFHPHTQICDLQ